MPPLPLVFGHRGAPAELPENTIAGFRRALEQGADGVELDVHLSADAVPVVIHDPALERTTAGQGRVLDLAWADLRPFVPSLDDVVHWAAGARAWLNVELKAAGTEAPTLAVLERHGVLDRTVVSSFSPEVVREVRRLEPAVPGYLLTETWDRAARAAVRKSGATGVCLGNDAATEPVLQQLRHVGLPVIVWTVNDSPRIRTLIRARVSGIISDHPGRAADLRRQLTA